MTAASRSSNPLGARAKRVEDSGRAAAAGWLGSEHVIALVSGLRPDFHAIVDGFGFRSRIKIVTATAVIMGLNGVNLDHSEWINPFLAWTAQRRDAGQWKVLEARRLIANLSHYLRRDGVRLQAVAPDREYSDGLGFAPDHFYLTLLLWLDIPLVGRTGTQIAADLPALPTVGWERTGPDMQVTDHANEQDVRDVFALRRSWRAANGQRPIRKPYAHGGRRVSPDRGAERERRRDALRIVLRDYPDVNANRLRATWEQLPSTPGGLLRTQLGEYEWDPPPSEATLRADLRAFREARPSPHKATPPIT